MNFDKNLLIFSENCKALNYLLCDRCLKGKVDLVYIDPPFATNGTFTITDGRATTISNSNQGEIAYRDTLLGADFVNYMKERLLMIKELLSDKGSIYLHTDYKIGHYLKVMMDEVFGIENFRNDITRVKCNPKNFKRIGYGNIKDMILFYTKTKNAIWHEPHSPYSEDDTERLFPKVDENGRRYATVPIHAPGEAKHPETFKGMLPPKGRHWRTDVASMEEWDAKGLIEWSSKGNPRKKIFADERLGKRVQDIWTDYKDPAYPIYPTEKNIDFIDLIVQTSSNPGSIVLDAFCGSGTALEAAARNGRRWIGIDKSELAMEITRKRMRYKQNEMGLFENDIEFVNLMNLE
ncbi:site-specific DNA-methyltransferase [Prevotella brunnea]|nr:site-specific DNA-methyltransferase [Prevotella brunnea]